MRCRPVVVALVVAVGLSAGESWGDVYQRANRGAPATTPPQARVEAQLTGLAVPFVKNVGQNDPSVAYYAPTFAGTVFVTRHGEIVHALPARRGADHKPQSAGWTLTESFVGGRAMPAAADPSATNVSLFLGNDSARWRAHAATSAAVSLGEVYPGIAVQLKAYGKRVEKVFTVQPGAKVAAIRVRVAGAQGLSVTSDGALAVRTGLGEVRLTRPVAYQEIDGERHAVAVAYAVAGDTYGFRVADYDARRPVVIDPLLQATYLGGSDFEAPNALALNANTGEVYVAGDTTSTDFPGTSGGAQGAYGGNEDAFVARLSLDLTMLDQVTYLGGSGDDTAYFLALNATTGEVYVAGSTISTDFPGTGGAQSANGGSYDGFVARLNPSLTTLDQATYLGGSGDDEASALALNASTGEVYVAGGTASSDFPGTGGGAQSAYGGGPYDGFVARLNPSLTTLDQATYLGGSGDEGEQGLYPTLALSATTGEVYVAGLTASSDFPGTGGGAQSAYGGGPYDGFVARLNPSLTTLDQATYLGGSGDEGGGAYATVALNASTGEVYVAGSTVSTDFPGTGGGAQSANAGGNFDGFVARLNASLTTLDQATYLGGSSGFDYANALALNASTGEVYVAGLTASTDFPGTSGGAQSTTGDTPGSGNGDAFVARLSPSLTTIDQATYLGGSNYDNAYALALNATTGEVYAAGLTASTDFPGTSGGAQSANAGGSYDAFVARLSADLAAATPTPAPTSIGTGTAGSCTEAALDAALGCGAATGSPPVSNCTGGNLTFNCGGTATITVTSTKTISADTTIFGGSLITISGGNSVGVFSVNTGVNFTVQNLTIANGSGAAAIGTTTAGGGILNNGGTVIVTNSIFEGNSAGGGTSGDGAGGAIFNNGGTVTVTNSTFANDSASGGLGGLGLAAR